ncbi:acyltransferase family protein [Terriglobus sp.]|uniref:acyltransferase family protein n=1 Tax=Terriglobus sp. TaxID=1889013 RepID=UPI003AFFDAF5
MATLQNSVLPVHQPLRKQVVGIDALRLTAAVLVMGSHLVVSSWLRSRNGGVMPTTSFMPLRPLFCYGWIGVEIFFVISGFVIAYSAQGVSAARFAKQRFFRLWPMCVMCALVAAGAALWMHAMPQRFVWRDVLETIAFVPGTHSTEYIDDPFWTLPVEAAFYLLVFLLIASRRLHLLPRVMAVAGAISCGYWALVTADPYWSGRAWLVVHKSLQHLSFYPSTLLLHGCFFATGVLLWDAMLRPGVRPAKSLHIAALVVTIAGCVMEIWYHSTIAAPYLEMTFPQWGAVAIWLTTVVMIWASVRHNAGLQHRIGMRGVNLLRAMGLVTYPLYLLHNRLGYSITMKLHAALGWYGAFAVAVSVVVLAAVVLALKIDPAIQGMLKRRMG